MNSQFKNSTKLFSFHRRAAKTTYEYWCPSVLVDCWSAAPTASDPSVESTASNETPTTWRGRSQGKLYAHTTLNIIPPPFMRVS